LQTGGLFGTQAQASTVLYGLSAGTTHTIGANYVGDSNYQAVPNSDTNDEFTSSVTVCPPAGTATSTSLAIKIAPAMLGDTGKFQVTVSPAPPASDNGNVTIWDAVGARSVTTSLVNGAATIFIPWTQAGTFTVYAVYSGSSTYASSSSNPAQSFTVNQGTPSISLVAPASALPNQQVSINAALGVNPANPALPYPTGSIQFWDALNGAAPQLLTTQPLTAGAGNTSVYGARLSPIGLHTLHVHYLGDNNWAAGDSPSLQINVDSPDFTLAISPPALSFTDGTSSSATITLTPINGFSGTVNLSCPQSSQYSLAGYNCTVSPSSVMLPGSGANGAATATLNIS